jgi:hypothetical protein
MLRMHILQDEIDNRMTSNAMKIMGYDVHFTWHPRDELVAVDNLNRRATVTVEDHERNIFRLPPTLDIRAGPIGALSRREARRGPDLRVHYRRSPQVQVRRRSQEQVVGHAGQGKRAHCGAPQVRQAFHRVRARRGAPLL